MASRLTRRGRILGRSGVSPFKFQTTTRPSLLPLAKKKNSIPLNDNRFFSFLLFLWHGRSAPGDERVAQLLDAADPLVPVEAADRTGADGTQLFDGLGSVQRPHLRWQCDQHADAITRAIRRDSL